MTFQGDVLPGERKTEILSRGGAVIRTRAKTLVFDKKALAKNKNSAILY